MDMRKLVGRNAARIRKQQNLTQEQLSAKSGLSQQYISGLEQGQRNPTIVTMPANESARATARRPSSRSAPRADCSSATHAGYE